MRVQVYRNLHNGLWSIKALSGRFKGRVIGYASAVMLLDAEFKVSQPGRERVLQRKRKEVHAGVVGNLATLQGWTPRAEVPVDKHRDLPVMMSGWQITGSSQVYYNPYRVPEFVLADDHDEACTAASLVYLFKDGSVRAWDIETYSLAAASQLELFAA